MVSKKFHIIVSHQSFSFLKLRACIITFDKILGIPTPPDRGPFIKEVTGHYLTLSWIPTKRAPPRYPQVTYVIEIRELPQKDWVLVRHF